MLFNSIQFLIFFPLVLTAFFALPHRYRWVLLLFASYYFYMCWKVEYALLMLVTTFTSYACGLILARQTHSGRRQAVFLAGLALLVTPLFIFKYLNFFSTQVNAVLHHFNVLEGIPLFNFLLPVGISFYTFHTISYLIDVYRGVTPAERHFGIYALYVSFFPQLVAGPISRSTQMLPQFHNRMAFDYNRIKNGMLLMAWGFFQKVVIADRLGLMVDYVYKDPTQHQGFSLMAATFLFAIQIYCDFAGYTDIAIGSMQIMGFSMPPNFKRPYLATSLSDFWKRWHMSLSTWFNEYVFTPITISKRDWGIWATVFALVVTFLVSGLWHGAGWTFIIWGGLYGLGLAAEVLTRKQRKRLAKLIPEKINTLFAWFLTFSYVCFTYIFFRANSLSDAFYIASHLFTGGSPQALLKLGVEKIETLIALLSIAGLFAVHLVQERMEIKDWFALRPAWQRWGFYYSAALFTIMLGRFGKQQFIYFQF
jgi:D-alanyl-lipoteichoic acid acyltransferase DltB (MBOAT superfamily)